MTMRFAFLLAAATLPAAALAQPPAAGAPAAATTPDTAAIAARLRARLLAGDTDRDGRLSRAEWLAMRAAMPGSGGGAGAGAGRTFDPGRMFDRLDANGDGFLDGAEIDTLIERRIARMNGAARGGRRGGMPADGAAGAGSGAAQDGRQPD